MDDAYHFNKKPGKTYVSRSVSYARRDGTAEEPMRIASKAIDGTDSYAFVKEKGELLIRRTSGGRQELVAKFFEDNRQINVLTLQRFGNPDAPHKTSFSFVGEEIDTLLEFLLNIKRLHFPDSGKINVNDEQLRTIVLSKEQSENLLTAENQDLLISLFETAITKQDVVALGYRRAQLAKFEKFLSDDVFFDLQRTVAGGKDEDVWQDFFEQNHWIFGYGLGFVFTSSLEGKGLEQVIRGYSLEGRGKRSDALLKTRSLISSLCFAEIKTHRTPLLHTSEYRPGAWRPHAELSGAVAQTQVTVQTALLEFRERHDPTDAAGNPTGEQLYNIQPRSFVVAGRLSEFQTETGVNKAKLRSFELYRRNLIQPEVITYDELYERAKFIVEHGKLVMHAKSDADQ